MGSGDVLLESRGLAGSDLVIASSADVTSVSGSLTLVATDDIRVGSDIVTGGAGTVYISAENNFLDAISGVAMNAGTEIRTADGDVLVRASNEGDVLLGLIASTAGNVSVSAEGSILDNNFGLNVAANQLRLVADANSNALGRIGASDLLNGDSELNANAIDTNVNTLSAISAEGIYVREVDGLVVDTTASVTVGRSNFNSSTTLIVDAARSDLITTAGGPIKVRVEQGSLTIRDGNANGFGVSANAAGDVLLQTVANDGDIEVNAAVRSGTGDLTLRSADDIRINAAVTSTGVGTIYLNALNGFADVAPALNGIDIQNAISTGSGDLLIDSSEDIRVAAALNTTGEIGFVAGRDVLVSKRYCDAS